jgi:hypothetical protein
MRSVGRPRNMKEPKELLDLWDEYKNHIDTHPDKENVVTVKGDVVKKETKKPYLRQGFEAFCFRKHGFSVTDYLSGKYEDFSQVVSCIRKEWEEDQISGTITGKYKAPNLVARLNGLTEKTENKNENTNIEIKAEFGTKTNES